MKKKKKIQPIGVIAVILVIVIFWVWTAGKYKSAFDSGEVKDGIYQNERAGLSFVIPEGWEIADSTAKRRTFSDGFKSDVAVYDILVGNEDYSEAMYVLAFDTSDFEDADIATPKYFLQELSAAFESAEGLGANPASINAVRFCGEDYYTLLAENTETGSVQRYYARRVEDCIVLVNVTSASTEGLSRTLMFFTPDASAVPTPLPS